MYAFIKRFRDIYYLKDIIKYKIVGAINLYFATVEIIFPTLYLIFFSRELINDYLTRNIHNYHYSVINNLLLQILTLLMGLCNCFFGIKLFSKSKSKDKYIIYGLILIIINLFLSYNLRWDDGVIHIMDNQ